VQSCSEGEKERVAVARVGRRYYQLAIEPAGAPQRRIHCVRTVGRPHHLHVPPPPLSLSLVVCIHIEADRHICGGSAQTHKRMCIQGGTALCWGNSGAE
jgi:hypothetical protein